MAKWKKDIDEFSVGLFYDDRRGCMATIPKPIIKKLKEPKGLIFKIKKNGDILIMGKGQ